MSRSIGCTGSESQPIRLISGITIFDIGHLLLPYIHEYTSRKRIGVVVRIRVIVGRIAMVEDEKHPSDSRIRIIRPMRPSLSYDKLRRHTQLLETFQVRRVLEHGLSSLGDLLPVQRGMMAFDLDGLDL